MIKNFKVNDKLKTQILIGTFSLVFTVSGFMLGREHLSNKNNDEMFIKTTSSEISELKEEMFKIKNNSENNEEVHFKTDEDYRYEKYIYDNKTDEMVYVGLVNTDIPPRDTNTVHYKYHSSYYESIPVEDHIIFYVYDEYRIDSNGDFKYVGEFSSSVPPKDDLHTHYKFKKSITMPEEENKNDKTR